MKLRIPLFIITLAIALYMSHMIGLLAGGKAQGVSYLVILLGLLYGFEKTKISEKRIRIITGISLVAMAIALEFWVEPQDLASLFATMF